MPTRDTHGPLLVVYYARGFPLRGTITDHLYSFRRHSGRPCFYLNMAERRPARHLPRMRFELVVFHTTFLSQRWDMAHFQRLVDKARPLRQVSRVRIALPQDEFLQTDALCQFLRAFDVTHVFSVMPEAEWPNIYPDVDRSQVQLFRILTGYLEDNTVARIERLATSMPQRDIDIGYRAWRAAPWLGRHGVLKADLADVFQRRAPLAGLRVDISTRHEDVLLGDAWYTFLLRCKYTLGVEGGASILDRDGAIRQQTETFMRQNPEASFAEVERACFPGADGSVHLAAISPRHLEACATRTCQVLLEGEYNSILKPGLHYIELKRDFSNLDAVLDLICRDTARADLTERAYRDIVASGAYTYRDFVELVLERSLGPDRRHSRSVRPVSDRALRARARAGDGLSRIRLGLALWWERLPMRIPPRLLQALLAARRALRRLVGGGRAT